MFQENIDSWESWGNIFTSIAAFTPIIDQCFSDANLSFGEPVENLMAGTNAVFRCGPYIIKISPPPECGKDFDMDWQTEIKIMAHCRKSGVSCPEVLASGMVSDTYMFRYLIMPYVEGIEASRMHPLQIQRDLIPWLKKTTRLLHKPFTGISDQKGYSMGFFTGRKPIALRESLQRELAAFSRLAIDLPNVLVHGDITGDNIIFDGKGFFLIDFGDALTAPVCYELPAIVFDLLRGDRALVQVFIGSGSKEDFLEQLILGTAIHEFGIPLIEGFIRQNHMDLAAVDNLLKLKSILRDILLQ